MPPNPFPSMKAKDLLKVLLRAPLSYRIVRQSGSHRKLEAAGRPPLMFAYHDGATCAPGVVRKILTDGVGMSEAEALLLL